MLYAESYSLLLEMLRRAPQRNDAADKAVATLAANAPYVDWESVCLSEWLPGGEE